MNKIVIVKKSIHISYLLLSMLLCITNKSVSTQAPHCPQNERCKAGVITYIISEITDSSLVNIIDSMPGSTDSSIINNKYEETLMFRLRVYSDSCADLLKFGLNNPQDYFSRVNYLSFDFKDNIWLGDGSNIIPCDYVTFIRTYGLAPYLDFIIVFKTRYSLNKESLVLSINDIIWNTGISICKL